MSKYTPTLRHLETDPLTRAHELPMARTVVRPGIGVWTPLCIIGGTVAAAVLAIVHHVFDSHFSGRTIVHVILTHVSQLSGTDPRVKPLEVQKEVAEVEVYLPKVGGFGGRGRGRPLRTSTFTPGEPYFWQVWHCLRHEAHPVADIDYLLGDPSVLTLLRVKLIFRAPATLAITSIILASHLITIFAPSLTARQASAVNRTLNVPTLDLLTDAMLGDIVLNTDNYAGPTGTWDQVVLAGLTSETPLGWTMPEGCAPECHYNITYFAPALRCSDLAPDQIDDRAGSIPGTCSHFLVFISRQSRENPHKWPQKLNVTVTDTQSVQFRRSRHASPEHSVEIDPPAAWLAGYDQELAGALTTGLVNFTAGSSVSVEEFHEPLNTTQRYNHVFNEGGFNNSNPNVGIPGVRFAPGLGSGLHYFAFADAMAARLLGLVQCDFHGTINAGDTLVLETNLFESPFGCNASETQRFTGLNSSASITNMSQGFVHTGTGFTTVNALVPSTDNIYFYNRRTLGATYLTAFVCLLAVSALGMTCLVSNGEPSSNSFSQLLIATRNCGLDPVADAVETDEKAAASIRLMFGEVDVPGRGVRAAFGQVSEQHVELLRRRR
ncbi:hypothetical protein DFH06DRAFT_1121136 [Mycena polygramma]|nr:hypothetical protein DFH06DRAFT_1121136 [Mycena polygramma]